MGIQFYLNEKLCVKNFSIIVSAIKTDNNGIQFDSLAKISHALSIFQTGSPNLPSHSRSKQTGNASIKNTIGSFN